LQPQLLRAQPNSPRAVCISQAELRLCDVPSHVLVLPAPCMNAAAVLNLGMRWTLVLLLPAAAPAQVQEHAGVAC
jgi:hypothetical protein